MERRGLNIRKGFLKVGLPMIRSLPLPLASRFVSGFGRMEYRVSSRAPDDLPDEAVDHGRSSSRLPVGRAAVSRELAGQSCPLADPRLAPRRRSRSTCSMKCSPLPDASTWMPRSRRVAAVSCWRITSVAHLLPAHWLFRENFPVRFYMERPRHISRYLARNFRADGPLGQDKLFISRQGVPADSAGSILRAARVLESGDVALSCRRRPLDRDSSPKRPSSWARMTRFSTTWVVLAAMTEVPVVMVFCRMEPDGRYHIEFRPAFRSRRMLPQNGKTGRMGAALHRDPGRSGSPYPANSNDYFFWEAPDALVA